MASRPQLKRVDPTHSNFITNINVDNNQGVSRPQAAICSKIPIITADVVSYQSVLGTDMACMCKHARIATAQEGY